MQARPPQIEHRPKAEIGADGDTCLFKGWGRLTSISELESEISISQSSSFAMAEVFQEQQTRGIFMPGCGPKCVFTARTRRRFATAPAGDPEGASLWRSLRREGIVV